MSKPTKRREWDTSTPGRPPALRDLKPTEDELRQALASPGAAMMSADDKELAHAAACVTTYKDNLDYFLGPDYTGQDKQQKILFYRHALAGALGDLGRFDEALAVLTNKKGSAHPQCSKAVGYLKKIKSAVDLDDDFECKCERPRAVVPKLAARNKDKDTVTLAMNRRQSTGKVYTEKHGKKVHLMRCTQCGLLNATEKIPERQIVIEELRLEAEAIQRGLLQSGVPIEKITARMWAGKSGPGFKPANSDEALLADSQ
jgi:hypothetical protein